MFTDKTFIISVLIGFMTLVGSSTFYKYSELQAVKSNIESAIVKGIDPVAVRCAYANEKDVVCVAYGVANHQNPLSSSKK
jgi:hypothetical protein